MNKKEAILLCEQLLTDLDGLIERVQAVDVDSSGNGNFKSNNSPEELDANGNSKTQMELKQAYNILKKVAPDVLESIKADADSEDLLGSDLSIDYRSPTGNGPAKVVVSAHIGGKYVGCVDLQAKKFYRA